MEPSITLTRLSEDVRRRELDNNNVQKVDNHRGILGCYQQKLIYSNVVLLATSHIFTIYFIFTFPYIDEWLLVIYSTTVGCMAGCGVTAAAHRYYTHRSFKATLPMNVIFLILYAMAGHNKIFDWVRDHRVHHKFSETNADPHNARRGFFFAHVGWLMMKKHPDVTRKGKSIDMSDIVNDQLVTWYDRNFVLMKLMFCFLLPILMPPLIWNASWYSSFQATMIRYIVVLNFTWLVNSAAHIYGTKPYDERINPAENLIVSILSLGEGWHNYHHTFPWDYRTSELGKINFTTSFLNFFAKIGWCYDLKYPSEDLVRKIADKYGDGSHK